MVSGFNARKAAQVVAYLANKAPNGRLNILKAIKLVYLADRESLRQSGFPILDDDRFSMPHGPVNSTTLRLANGELEDASWSEIIADRSNHELSVTDAGKICDWDELSDAEIQCLDTVWQEFGHMDPFVLRDWTHDPKNLPDIINRSISLSLSALSASSDVLASMSSNLSSIMVTRASKPLIKAPFI